MAARDPEQVRLRLLDIHRALDERQCVSDLARKWGVTRQGASLWLRNNVDISTQKELVSNSVIVAADKRRGFDVGARLELIALCRANGWTWEKISFAVGVSVVALWSLIRLHAPDGLAAALEDMCDEAEAA